MSKSQRKKEEKHCIKVIASHFIHYGAFLMSYHLLACLSVFANIIINFHPFVCDVFPFPLHQFVCGVCYCSKYFNSRKFIAKLQQLPACHIQLNLINDDRKSLFGFTVSFSLTLHSKPTIIFFSLPTERNVSDTWWWCCDGDSSGNSSWVKRVQFYAHQEFPYEFYWGRQR